MADWAPRDTSTGRFDHCTSNGASRARTDDLLAASQTLSQLSYSPRVPARKCSYLGCQAAMTPLDSAARVRSIAPIAYERAHLIPLA